MYSRILETAAEYPTAVDEDQDDNMSVDGDHHGLPNASTPEEGDQTTAVFEADHEGYDAEDEASSTSGEEEGKEQMEVESEKKTKVTEEEDEGEQVDRPMVRGVSAYPTLFPLSKAPYGRLHTSRTLLTLVQTSMHSNELFEEYWDIELHHVSSIEEAGNDAAASLAADDNEMEAEEEMVPIFPPYSQNSTDTMTDHQRR